MNTLIIPRSIDLLPVSDAERIYDLVHQADIDDLPPTDPRVISLALLTILEEEGWNDKTKELAGWLICL